MHFSISSRAVTLQALAREVVALEERCLHARSAELRAGKQAGEMALEARRARHLQASTAAECSNLRATVAAFQVSNELIIFYIIILYLFL
jgi:hypothetical protein